MNASDLPAIRVLVMAGAMGWLCVAALDAGAAEHRFACPLWIEPDAVKAHYPPEGWTAVMPQKWRLDGAGLLHGAPDEAGYLKPDEARIEKAGNQEVGVARWKLGPLPHAHETWLYCGYGPLQLFRRIPVDAVECTATTYSEHGTFVGTGFVCT